MDTQLQQAITRLRAHGKYDWLLNGKDLWLASEIAQQISQLGIKTTSNLITAWIKEYPSAQDFGRLGIGASREDFIKLLASRVVSKTANE